MLICYKITLKKVIGKNHYKKGLKFPNLVPKQKATNRSGAARVGHGKLVVSLHLVLVELVGLDSSLRIFFSTAPIL